ncbi:efflux RND transporter periplasmic adaptor subunit [Massilia sp. LXY-6]|uniref:efflux RND transporter periplasmic adaptor subunit n=1 Tax=Massilia sp. LXY-6 TaxID=3379823 RepID=UPI003EE0F7BB
MNSTSMIIALLVAGIVGAGGYSLYQAGLHKGQAMAMPGPAGATAPGDVSGTSTKIDPATGRKVLYWHDPMVPGQRFDKQGKSPFMDMELVPVYADDAGNSGGISISQGMRQNLGIRTTEVRKGKLGATVEAVGNVAYNERDIVLVQARGNGFVEKLYVRAPLDPVKKGQRLAELYVPDWVAAQEEYLSVKRMKQELGAAGLLDAARQRMRLAGMSEDQIRLVETSGRTHPRLTVTAPIDGFVTELGAREGMTVANGAQLFRINGLHTVWVNAELAENVAAQVRPGTAVQASTPALPGTVFTGKVGALLPEINAETRTIKARIELANPSGALVPGMFATVSLRPASSSEVLLVPSEAVIQTGKRSLVIVEQGDGQFKPVEVEPGAEGNGQTEIRRGLEAGQKVVASGQFLLDSEASLKGLEARMSGAAQAAASGPAPSTAAVQTHHGVGKVEAITKGEVTISHGPIPSLRWPPMTMGFKPPPAGLPDTVRVGSSVSFDIRPTEDGSYEIVRIVPDAGAAK